MFDENKAFVNIHMAIKIFIVPLKHGDKFEDFQPKYTEGHHTIIMNYSDMTSFGILWPKVFFIPFNRNFKGLLWLVLTY